MASHSDPFTCPDCQGPSRMWRGDVHRWRCDACTDIAIGLTPRNYSTEKVTP